MVVPGVDDKQSDRMPDLVSLPKAHLHLHFTGSMRPQTLVELADKHGIQLPETLLDQAVRDQATPPLTPDARGWFRFQRRYDAARACVRDADDMTRIVHEAAADDAAEGSRWLELQVDPTSYAPHVGGLIPALEIVLDAAAAASRTSRCQVAVIVAASRTRHPLEARTLARLAARYAGNGPGTVVGFGLSNDERRGTTSDFAPAFAIAAHAGLAAVPHAGELLGPEHVAATVESLHPHRIGHGVRSAENTRVLQQVMDAGIALEICPASNVSLGVYRHPNQVPLRELLDAGAQVALGADDPLLFGSRLVEQYRQAYEVHGLGRKQLAELGRSSMRASLAPGELKTAVDAEITAWEHTA